MIFIGFHGFHTFSQIFMDFHRFARIDTDFHGFSPIGWILGGSWVDLGWILGGSWVDLGRILGGSWADLKRILGGSWWWILVVDLGGGSWADLGGGSWWWILVDLGGSWWILGAHTTNADTQKCTRKQHECPHTYTHNRHTQTLAHIGTHRDAHTRSSVYTHGTLMVH